MPTSKKNVVSFSAAQINAEYLKAKTSMVDSVNHIIECGRMLAEKKADLGHGKFIPWVESNCDFTPRAAQMMMRANTKSASHLTEDDAIGISRDTWGNSVTHGTQGTGENEWYTPAQYIDAARLVLGEIDLDPASSALANKTVRAANIFTAEDSGLQQDWAGRVWMNPPYSRILLPKFVDKFLQEYRADRVTHGIVLTHAYTDTEWFHKLAKGCRLLCLTRGRISFEDTSGNRAAPTQGQAFFYFGDDDKAFTTVFSEIGLVYQRR